VIWGLFDVSQEQCDTWEVAEKGHKAWIERVKAETDP
jgi:hypothetical protein